MKQHNKTYTLPAVATLTLGIVFHEAQADPVIAPTHVEAHYTSQETKKDGTYPCKIGAAVLLTQDQYHAGDIAEYLVDVFASCDVQGKQDPLPVHDWNVAVYLAKKDGLNDPSQHTLWRTFTTTYSDSAHPVTELEYQQARPLPATMEPGKWIVYTAGKIGGYQLQHASFDEFEILGQQKKEDAVKPFDQGTTFVYSRDGIFKTNVTLPTEKGFEKVTMPGNFKIKFKPILTEEARANGYSEKFLLCGAQQYNGKEDKIGFYANETDCLEVEADEGKRLKIVGEKPAGWFMRLLRGTDARISTVVPQENTANVDLERRVARVAIDDHGRPMEDNSGMVIHSVYDANNTLLSRHQFRVEVGNNSTSPVLAFGAGYLAGLGTGLLVNDTETIEVPVKSNTPEETEESQGTYTQGNETNLVE